MRKFEKSKVGTKGVKWAKLWSYQLVGCDKVEGVDLFATRRHSSCQTCLPASEIRDDRVTRSKKGNGTLKTANN